MAKSAETDRQLVERVKRGDKRAFDLLTLKYQQGIVNLVSRTIGDRNEVLDVTQEAFIKAYRALPGFRGDSQFYTWLYRIAINTARNHLVARSRRPPLVDLEVDGGDFQESGRGLADTADPESQLARDELEETIRRALNDLPEELKVAVTLREYQCLSYEEIAEIMDCPVGTVRSRIFRARDAIERRMAALEAGEGTPETGAKLSVGVCGQGPASG